jgi:hypothetical protein
MSAPMVNLGPLAQMYASLAATLAGFAFAALVLYLERQRDHGVSKSRPGSLASRQTVVDVPPGCELTSSAARVADQGLNARKSGAIRSMRSRAATAVRASPHAAAATATFSAACAR